MIIIDKAMLRRFAGPGRCEYCQARHHHRHPHHLRCRGFGGGSRLDIAINLMSLCPPCHRRCHDGFIARGELLAIVARREQRSAESITDEVNKILRTPRP